MGREKAASFTRHLVESGRLTADQIAPLAKALPPLVDGLGSESGMQYREVVSQCAAELAKVFKAQCPAELTAAVQKRLAELKVANDPEYEQELVALLEYQESMK